MARVILIHGFNVRDGGNATVGKLRPFFEQAGFSVMQPRYGWTFLLGVRLLDKRFATLVADLTEPGDVYVGHSNGCCIAQLAAEMGAPVSQMVYINPALDRDTFLPRHVGRLHVWHSPADGPVRFARWLPWHRWGDMGAVGYQGPHDTRVINYNKQEDYPQVSSIAHSDVFEHGKLQFFAPKIVDAVVAHRHSA